MVSSVTAVVVTWDAASDVVACLDALRAQDHRPLDVVVVDNASRDVTRSLVATFVDDDHQVPVVLLEQQQNRGFAGGVNIGIAHSSADAVLLVNPDAVLAPDHVGRLVRALADDPGLGSVQGTLVRGPGPDAPVDSAGHVGLRPRLWRNRGEGRALADLDDLTTPVHGVTGAAALHRRAMLDDVAVPGPDGPEWLDETLFAYYDDVDLDWRAALRGWRAAHVPAALGVHRRGGAARSRPAVVEELNAANRLLLLAKLDDPRRLVRVLPQTLVTTLVKLLWLCLTNPRAAAAVPGRLRAGWAPTRRRRAHVLARSVRSSAAVTAGYRPLDVSGWVRTWWRRVRGAGR